MKIIIILFFLIAETIFSAGYTLPVFGTRNSARGGAFMSKADDLTAIKTNPANMIKFKGLNSYFSLGLIKTDSEISYYHRFDENELNGTLTPEITSYKPINNDAFFPNPTIIISDDFGMDKFNFSFGVYGPYAPDYNYDKRCPSNSKASTCPNRYGLFSSDITQADIQITIAYQILSNLSVGLGLKNSYINFVYDLDIIAAMGGLDDLNAKAGLYDMNFKFDVTDMINPNFNFGLTYAPIKSVVLSFVYQSPISVSADGKLTSTPNSYFVNEDGDFVEKNQAKGSLPDGLKDKDLNVELNLPHIFSVGIMYEIKDLFNIEFDFSYEMWSVHDKVVITPVNVEVDLGLGEPIKLGAIEQIKKWKDTMRFSLGGDYALNKNIVISLGGFYEQGAIPDEYYDNSILDTDKIGFTTGASYRWSNYDFYLSFAYIDFLEKDITNSKVTPGNSFPNEKLSQEFMVGNGLYNTDIFILGLGVNAKF